MSFPTGQLTKAQLAQAKLLIQQAGGLDRLAEDVSRIDLDDSESIYGYGYLRISDPSKEDPESLKTQEKIIRDYAKLHNIVIIEVYKDVGFSGNLPAEERIGFRNLLWSLQPGQCMVGAAADRLFRNEDERKRISSFLNDKSCTMRAPDYMQDDPSKPEVKFIQAVQGAANQLYRDQIAKKIRDGKRRLAMEGTLATKPYYGWKSGGPGQPWVEVPYEQGAIKVIQKFKTTNPKATISMVRDELVNNGYPDARRLYNEEGTLRKKTKWCYGTLEAIITRLGFEASVKKGGLPGVHSNPPPGPLQEHPIGTPVPTGYIATSTKTPGPPKPPVVVTPLKMPNFHDPPRTPST